MAGYFIILSKFLKIGFSEHTNFENVCYILNTTRTSLTLSLRSKFKKSLFGQKNIFNLFVDVRLKSVIRAILLFDLRSNVHVRIQLGEFSSFNFQMIYGAKKFHFFFFSFVAILYFFFLSYYSAGNVTQEMILALRHPPTAS